jgi:hypothetical protein
MKDQVAVVFGSDGQIRIYHGVDPLVYSNRADAVLNPVYPKDADGHVVPPHLWKLSNGKITTDSETTKKPTKLLNNLSWVLLGLAVSGLGLFLVYKLW